MEEYIADLTKDTRFKYIFASHAELERLVDNESTSPILYK